MNVRSIRFVLASAVALVIASSTHAVEAQQPAPRAQDTSEPARGQDPMRQGADMGQLDDQRAREHFRIGRAYYDQGRFAEAAVEFQAAYDLSHRTTLLYNCYVAYRDSGDLARAVQALEQYLAAPDAQDRVTLTARLDALRTAQRRQEESRDSAAAEAHERGAAEVRRTLTTGPSTLSWITMGTGAAMLVAGAITGFLALGKSNDLDAMCPMNYCAPGFESDRDSLRTLSITTDVLLFGGGAVAGLGVVLAILSSGQPLEQEPPPATASCGPTGCRVDLQVSF